MGWQLFRLMLEVASGRRKTWAEQWKLHNALEQAAQRQVSLPLPLSLALVPACIGMADLTSRTVRKEGCTAAAY